MRIKISVNKKFAKVKIVKLGKLLDNELGRGIFDII